MRARWTTGNIGTIYGLSAAGKIMRRGTADYFLPGIGPVFIFRLSALPLEFEFDGKGAFGVYRTRLSDRSFSRIESIMEPSFFPEEVVRVENKVAGLDAGIYARSLYARAYLSFEIGLHYSMIKIIDADPNDKSEPYDHRISLSAAAFFHYADR
jgi:hypothetical protein